MSEKLERKKGHGWLDCTTVNCRNYSRDVGHDYCAGCRRIVKQVQDNARRADTKEKPDFLDALRIAERCFEIAKNEYASPEQLEWAIMILPDVFFYLYEPCPSNEC